MSTEVNRRHLEETIQPKRLDPWPYGLSEALRIGVRKGRIDREDAAILRGLLYHPNRRSLEGRIAGDYDEANLLESLRQYMINQAPKEQNGFAQCENIQFNWCQHKDWLADHLPQLCRHGFILMAQYPIPL